MAGLARSVGWLAFFAAVVAAWLWLYAMARASGLDWLGRPVGLNMMPMDAWGGLFAMWAVMMAAMMGPTLVPTLSTYEALIRSADGNRAGWWGVLAGYFAVWLLFAAVIAGAQLPLLRAGVVDLLGRPASKWLAAGLLIAVGIYQFTWMKRVCHSVCHAPMTYFLGRWRPGFRGGLRMGWGLGAFCAGCCWGFMALGFAAGTMSLIWMGLATALMVLEKLPQVARHVTKPAGAALILAGAVVAVA